MDGWWMDGRRTELGNEKVVDFREILQFPPEPSICINQKEIQNLARRYLVMRRLESRCETGVALRVGDLAPHVSPLFTPHLHIHLYAWKGFILKACLRIISLFAFIQLFAQFEMYNYTGICILALISFCMVTNIL